ncbi:MAG: hypothetical protein V1856_02275 [Candidatus Liptonbacteria bacterium]
MFIWGVSFNTNAEIIRAGMFLALLFCGAVFLILGIIMKYHWTRYGVPGPRHRLFWAVYFLGGVILLAAMAASVITYIP